MAKKPIAPKELKGEALAEWGRVCSDLSDAGRLKDADRAMISLWCTTWAVWVDATRQVNSDGPVCHATNGILGKSPWYTVQRECHTALVKLALEMGLTCSSRDYDRITNVEPADLT